MREFIIWRILYYLRFWARIALVVNKPYVIGVAGSVGKSSTRNALHAVLKDHFKVKVVSGNSETGVPLGILGIATEGFTYKNWLLMLFKAPFGITHLRNTRYLIVEMGIDDPNPPKNMSYLLTIVTPEMSIDLNATATHTMQFEKLLSSNTKNTLDFLLTKIAEEDSKIITNRKTKIGIFNWDDLRLRTAVSKKAKDVKLFTFGSASDCDIVFKDYSITTKKTKFTYDLKSEKGTRTVELSFSGLLLPPAARESFGAVILACMQLGLKFSQVKESLEKNFAIPKGRSTLFSGVRGTLIIDSSYNSSKSTVLSFLEVLKELRQKTGKKTVFLMGDMRELGTTSQVEHEEVARMVAESVDELYCVGPLTQEFVMPYIKNILGKKGKTQKAEWYKNAIQAGLHMKEEVSDNSIILVKGSQNTLFLEESIKFLLENQVDSKNLTRQEEYWMKIKQNFFSVE